MAKESEPTPSEQVMRLYEEAEAQAARASERLVGSGGFAAVLGMAAENAAALAKLSGDAMDLVLRNLRLAGRRDVIRLGRQLARTEDKLERVLQELEGVRDELAPRQGSSSTAAGRSSSANGSGGRRRSTGSRRTKAS